MLGFLVVCFCGFLSFSLVGVGFVLAFSCLCFAGFWMFPERRVFCVVFLREFVCRRRRAPESYTTIYKLDPPFT